MEQVQEVLLLVASCVSCAGCGLLLATWKRVEAPSYVSRRIVTSLGRAGLVTSIAFAMSLVVNGLGQNYRHHEGLCYAQALTLQYFYLASYFWTACFAFHLYQVIVKRNEYPEEFLWVYRGVGWGLPGVMLVYLVLRQLTGHLGVGGADRRWCWIAVHTTQEDAGDDSLVWRREGAMQQLSLFYLPVLCVFVFNVGVYRTILKFLHMDPMASRFREKVKLYVGIFFLCSIWGIIHRLVQFFRTDHSPNEFLGVMESMCDPLQPLLNAVIYGTNKQSLETYKERFCPSWIYYSSLPSSDDEEPSGIDDSPLLPQVVGAFDGPPLDPLDREFGHYFDRGAPRSKLSRQHRARSVSR
ncbi:Slime mold cyclic AMP receptor [Phytophthora infestans]|uniref:Slime mold cyclic AMP receptor n=1 Tax=Phytophthora infestans TaxID=4787 RepID=A0A833W215_PHYIN|nr:Slime mold cyclic AMP receptor [Phytophthora infestans]KAF4135062.1 Slime mold cyclic AMP receptor [Phytophthora infestans]